mgnify:CR=1 FL=1
MINESDRRMFSIKQMAMYLECSVSTVRKRLKQRPISFVFDGRRKLYHFIELFGILPGDTLLRSDRNESRVSPEDFD